MQKNKVLFGNLIGRFVAMLLTPIVEGNTFVPTYRFEGYKAIASIFPDAIIADLVAKQLGKTVETEILFEELALIKKLVWIPLDVNEATQIQDLTGIGYLSQLKVLRLHSGVFAVIPHEIAELKALRELDLTESKLQTIPDALYDLSTLRTLKVRSTQLHELSPLIKKLRYLEELDLSDNQLTKLPVEIGLLDELMTLDLSQNPLADLPSEVGYLNSLETLNISETNMKEVPAILSHIDSLNVINLNKTVIESVDDVFLQTSPDDLKIIGEQFSMNETQIAMITENKNKKRRLKAQKDLQKGMMVSLGIVTTCVAAIFFITNKMQRKIGKRN